MQFVRRKEAGLRRGAGVAEEGTSRAEEGTPGPGEVGRGNCRLLLADTRYEEGSERPVVAAKIWKENI